MRSVQEILISAPWDIIVALFHFHDGRHCVGGQCRCHESRDVTVGVFMSASTMRQSELRSLSSEACTISKKEYAHPILPLFSHILIFGENTTMDVNPTYPLFPIFAFLGFVLVLIPLPWHLQAWNAGTCMYIAWTAVACLLQFVNSVVWRNNALNIAPVFCDICTFPVSTALHVTHSFNFFP